MKTSNPALSDRVLRGVRTTTAGGGVMTVNGTITRSFVLIVLLMASAIWSWQSAYPEGWSESAVPSIPGWYMPVLIGGFILAMIVIFMPKSAPFLAPVYAVVEGLALGAISALFEMKYPGIVGQAMLSTCGTFAAMLMCYRSGLIQPTEKFRAGVVAATMGIALVYIIDLVLRIFGINVPFIHETGIFGIGFSLVVVGIAALNLILDFDTIEKSARAGLPKYFEWYCAFGLLVTLVWLYLEILRLLSKAKSR